MHKLDLKESQIQKARSAAHGVVLDIYDYIKERTTTSVERTVVRLFGVDGTTEDGIPLPNVVVNKIFTAGKLGRGAAFWLANATLYHQSSPQEVAEGIAADKIQVCKVPVQDEGKIRARIMELALAGLHRIDVRREERQKLEKSLGTGREPLLYVIVATGNIYEDIKQAKAAAHQGADVVAVIRTTAQSLLDYVPFGATTEGFGGTYATQENFRLMREALDEAGEQVGKYIYLTNYCSGLCMPEIAAMGAVERLDMMLNDSMYGIIFRDINMQRTFVDQYFSRMINGYAGITIQTGEDNYLTTADAVEAAHTVLASQFINEQFAFLSGMAPHQVGLGHAFEINPDREDSFLLELAQAQMCRQIFPESRLKYMPPTKYATGNVFRTHLINGLFNAVSVMTDQNTQLLGMMTEAIHTPHIADRSLALDNARYVFSAMRHLGEEIYYKPDGRIQRRAAEVLDEAAELLEEINSIGLMETIKRGTFADISRKPDGGKGLDGVVFKDPDYFNPFYDLMKQGGV